jgi:hypothetical protein
LAAVGLLLLVAAQAILLLPLAAVGLLLLVAALILPQVLVSRAALLLPLAPPLPHRLVLPVRRQLEAAALLHMAAVSLHRLAAAAALSPLLAAQTILLRPSGAVAVLLPHLALAQALLLAVPPHPAILLPVALDSASVVIPLLIKLKQTEMLMAPRRTLF